MTLKEGAPYCKVMVMRYLKVKEAQKQPQFQSMLYETIEYQVKFFNVTVPCGSLARGTANVPWRWNASSRQTLSTPLHCAESTSRPMTIRYKKYIEHMISSSPASTSRSRSQKKDKVAPSENLQNCSNFTQKVKFAKVSAEAVPAKAAPRRMLFTLKESSKES